MLTWKIIWLFLHYITNTRSFYFDLLQFPLELEKNCQIYWSFSKIGVGGLYLLVGEGGVLLQWCFIKKIIRCFLDVFCDIFDMSKCNMESIIWTRLLWGKGKFTFSWLITLINCSFVKKRGVFGYRQKWPRSLGVFVKTYVHSLTFFTVIHTRYSDFTLSYVHIIIDVVWKETTLCLIPQVIKI